MVKEIYEKELSFKIIGCAIQVHKVLGSGYMEKLYERALLVELAENGLKVESQVPVQVHYKNILIGDYKMDIIVENKVILELKACSKIIPVHEAQLIQYLYASGIKIGYVINFGSSGKLEYVRKVV
jgi:GxxExxY protein